MSALGTTTDTFILPTKPNGHADDIDSAIWDMPTASSQSAVGPWETNSCVRVRIPVNKKERTNERNKKPMDVDPPFFLSFLWCCRATSKVGVPGTPGTVDLIHALRRLTPKTITSGATGVYAAAPGWRTPDSIMSTGSRSALSSMNSFQCNPERLKVKLDKNLFKPSQDV